MTTLIVYSTSDQFSYFKKGYLLASPIEFIEFTKEISNKPNELYTNALYYIDTCDLEVLGITDLSYFDRVIDLENKLDIVGQVYLF